MYRTTSAVSSGARLAQPSGAPPPPPPAQWAATGKVPVAGFRRRTPASVTIPAMRCAGVTSKEGFHTPIPGAATCCPLKWVISSAGRCSITMLAPDGVAGSSVVRGAAT